MQRFVHVLCCILEGLITNTLSVRDTKTFGRYKRRSSNPWPMVRPPAGKLICVVIWQWSYFYVHMSCPYKSSRTCSSSEQHRQTVFSPNINWNQIQVRLFMNDNWYHLTFWILVLSCSYMFKCLINRCDKNIINEFLNGVQSLASKTDLHVLLWFLVT